MFQGIEGLVDSCCGRRRGKTPFGLELGPRDALSEQRISVLALEPVCLDLPLVARSPNSISPLLNVI